MVFIVGCALQLQQTTDFHNMMELPMTLKDLTNNN
jgi:hypothetical protein